LPALFDRFWLWSARGPAPARFRRADYLTGAAGPDQPLRDAVLDRVADETGRRPLGAVRLLTHLRYFGHGFNPVSFYYCYGAARPDGSETLEAIVAEITNTPWKERHAYVLNVAGTAPVNAAAASQAWRFEFDKRFHVSPFLPMTMHYRWQLEAPGETLRIYMQNFPGSDSSSGLAFDASLDLRAEALTSAHLARALATYPLMTLRVVALIHWQAVRLWFKRTPFYTHSDKPRTTQQR
ncbi:MAG: DUF1365 domain-containing protein, partial [Steroidobacteraceae bacterium]